MGCNIHGWVEVNTGDKWVATKELKDRDRNYKRFADLAGVRDYGEKSKAIPLGVPSDVSETAKYDIERWGSDGHSHSFLPLKEAAQIFLDSKHEPRDYERQYPESAFFDYEDEDVTKARLVFWFDN